MRYQTTATLMGIIALVVLLNLFFNVEFITWKAQGTYRMVTVESGAKIGYLETDGQPITYTFPGENGKMEKYIAIYLFVPAEGEPVMMYRLYIGLKWPNTGIYIHFITRN